MTGVSDNIWRDRLRAEREQAAAAGQPFAQRLECDLRWDMGAPLPTILTWEHEAHLFFRLAGDEGVGRIIFEYCRASTFGPPGEEGHALQGRGWEPYTPLQVMNSRWLADTLGSTEDVAHFLFPFHDTTYECLAGSFRASRLPHPLADAVRLTLDAWK